MTNMETFTKDFIAIQKALMHDYPDEAAVCHMLHDDLGLGRTPREDAEERAAELTEMTGQDVEPDVLDLTVEHGELHDFLMGIKAQALMMQASMDQVLSAMFVIGRRYGLKEAAGALSHGVDDGPLSLEDWLKGHDTPSEPDAS